MTASLSDLRARPAKTPPTREDRFTAELERQFPGSEWVEDAPTIPEEPQPASTGSGAMGTGEDPREGGAGAQTFVIIGGGKYNLRRLKKFLTELEPGAIVHHATIRRTKAGEPIMNPGSVPQVEAVVSEQRSDQVEALEAELRSDLFGPKARDAQVEALLAPALAGGATVVLVGSGGRVTAARSVLGRFAPRYQPPLVELP